MTIVDLALSLLRPAPGAAPKAKGKSVSLALQGGGSFGAFTWGVLDRLLEDDDLAFDTVSGASAGAINAVLLAAGLLEGGREQARARLERFWRGLSQASPGLGFGGLGKEAGLDFLATVMSPYQFNPLDLNPLRASLLDNIDFARLAGADALRVMIATTRVSDGKLRMFRNADLSLDAVLASACLPQYQQAVMIDSEAYWDGGYALNPPLAPLAHESRSAHILVVQLTPARAEGLPRTRHDIRKHIDRIHFNATLNAQLEALRIGAEVGATDKLQALRIDTIAAEDEVQDLVNKSATNVDWNFLTELRDAGRRAAEIWAQGGAPAGSRGGAKVA